MPFPQYHDEVTSLVSDHLALRDEPLRLAVYYAPERDPHDIFLFEVIDNFGGNEVDPRQNITEMTFSATEMFGLPPSQRVHLLLTNPLELSAAAAQRWGQVEELRGALNRRRATVIYPPDGETDELLRMVRG